jgi:hypothetical protein
MLKDIGGKLAYHIENIVIKNVNKSVYNSVFSIVGSDELGSEELLDVISLSKNNDGEVISTDYKMNIAYDVLSDCIEDLYSSITSLDMNSLYKTTLTNAKPFNDSNIEEIPKEFFLKELEKLSNNVTEIVAKRGLDADIDNSIIPFKEDIYADIKNIKGGISKSSSSTGKLNWNFTFLAGFFSTGLSVTFAVAFDVDFFAFTLFALFSASFFAFTSARSFSTHSLFEHFTLPRADSTIGLPHFSHLSPVGISQLINLHCG